MASYEVEHNIKEEAKRRSTRPDMSSFFSAYEQAAQGNSKNNPHATPTPVDIANARNIYGSSLRVMADEISRMVELDEETSAEYVARLESMMSEVEALDELEGVTQDYLDGLERVPNKYLKKGMTCPICAVEFLDDEYPLVVRLPCHKDHLFDLECIGPWLLMKPTCPLDRQILVKKKEKVKPVVDDDEEEYDEYYA